MGGLNVVVLGASGALGHALVHSALEAGHQVCAYVRNRGKLNVNDARLRVVEGQLSDRARLLEALGGADAVLSALGVPRAKPRSLPSRDLPVVLGVMEELQVKRLVAVSGAAVNVQGDRKTLPDKLVRLVMKLVVPEVLEDKEVELALLRASNLEWTTIRPPRIIQGKRTGSVQVSQLRPLSMQVIYDDLADFMVKEMVARQHVRQSPFVSGP